MVPECFDRYDFDYSQIASTEIRLAFCRRANQQNQNETNLAEH
jgi:hypothetical protein